MRFINRKTLEQNAALFLAALLLLFLSGCGGAPVERAAPAPDDGGVSEEQQEETAELQGGTEPDDAGETDDFAFDPVVMRLGALKGPSAMGLIKLMSDVANGDDTYGNYEFTLAASPDEITPRLIQGELDIACVPANLAAALYNRTDSEIITLSVNTLGALYIVEKGGAIQSIEDLRGMTIASAGKGSAPEYALRYLLTQNGLDPDTDVFMDWKSEHNECVAALATGGATVALLPQPFVTAAQNNVEDLRVALDLTQEWDALQNGSTLITGVTVARRSFVEEHAAAVSWFLDGYAESTEWVNANVFDAAALIGAADIVPTPVAEKALPHCNIVCLTGDDMKTALSGYLSALYDAAPDSVGGALPKDDFYYYA